MFDRTSKSAPKKRPTLTHHRRSSRIVSHLFLAPQKSRRQATTCRFSVVSSDKRRCVVSTERQAALGLSCLRIPSRAWTFSLDTTCPAELFTLPDLAWSSPSVDCGSRLILWSDTTGRGSFPLRSCPNLNSKQPEARSLLPLVREPRSIFFKKATVFCRHEKAKGPAWRRTSRDVLKVMNATLEVCSQIRWQQLGYIKV